MRSRHSERPMPRYFFHRTDGYFQRDDEGVELESLQAARIEAVTFAGASLAEEPEQVWNGQDFRVQVTDEQGLLLFTVITLAIDAPAVGIKPSAS
jgi:hypothetical protein